MSWLVAPARRKRILSLALPIMGGMVSQNIMNLVDTAMVARVGQEALAAVGIASFAVFLSQAFLMGLSSGVQAMAARRKGQGRLDEMAIPLNGGLVLSLLIGAPVSAVLFIYAPDLFPLLVDDGKVIDAGVPYYQSRVVAVVAVAANFSFRGYWNGVDLSKLYLRTLVQMHVLNLFLNYVLIFGKLGFPELGATGAGVGTTISVFFGTVTYLVLGFRHARQAGFAQRLPDAETTRTMLKLSVPNGIQQVFFSGGLVALFKIIGMVGTAELAAAQVLIQLVLVGILPSLGLGLAATSLVGQALGRKDPEDAKRWGYDVQKLGTVIVALLAAPMWLVPGPLLRLFLGTDEHTIEVALLPLRIAGLAMVFDATNLILMNALLGAGDARRVAIIATGLQWLFSLPLIYLVGPVWGYGLVGIWIMQGLTRLLQSVIFFVMWSRGTWQKIKV